MTDRDIRGMCNRLADLLIRKHKNYGSSAEQPPVLIPGMDPGVAIRVRMSDKIARLAALSAGQADLVGESAFDTNLDLAGYCILWAVLYEERTKEMTADTDAIPGTDYNWTLKKED